MTIVYVFLSFLFLQTESKSLELKEESFYSSEITMICFHHDDNECAIACSNNVNLHAFPDISTVKQALIYRSSLPITHMEYTRNNSHMYVHLSRCIRFLHSNFSSFISSQAPGIKVYSKSVKKIILTIDTQDIGVRTFNLSSCGKYLGMHHT